MITFLAASVLFIQQMTSCPDGLPCRQEFFLTQKKVYQTQKTELRRPAVVVPVSPPVRIRVEDLKPTNMGEEQRESVHRIVYFDFDSSKLKASEKAKLDDIKGKKGRFTITGYTCDLGSKEYNDRLALERARSVQRYLGVEAEVTGRGKCCYVGSDRSKNRRVEISGQIISSQSRSLSGRQVHEVFHSPLPEGESPSP